MRVHQALIVNLDTPFSSGRLTAQAAHGSILSILQVGTWEGNTFSIKDAPDYLKYWMEESFTKISYRYWGRENVLRLKEEAEALGIPTALMEEEGYVTALSLGPYYSEEIKKLTKGLPLL